MKKKTIYILFGFVVLIAVILIWNFSNREKMPPDDEVSGTIGKVEKYRKQQLTAKDIILSDEVLRDTIALKNTIADLGQFAQFSIETSALITASWLPVLKANWNTDEGKEVIKSLEGFAKFIETNVEKIAKTQNTLFSLYKNKESVETSDIGASLANFVNYIYQLRERDSVIDHTIKVLNNHVFDNKYSEGDFGKNLAKLKEIRDKIIISNFMYGLFFGDREKMSFAAHQQLGGLGEIIIDAFGSNSPIQEAVFRKMSDLNIIVYSYAGKDLSGFYLSGALEFTELKTGFTAKYDAVLLNQNNLNMVFGLEIGSTEKINYVAGSPLIGAINNKELSVLVASQSTVNASDMNLVINSLISANESIKLCSVIFYNKPSLIEVGLVNAVLGAGYSNQFFSDN